MIRFGFLKTIVFFAMLLPDVINAAPLKILLIADSSGWNPAHSDIVIKKLQTSLHRWHGVPVAQIVDTTILGKLKVIAACRGSADAAMCAVMEDSLVLSYLREFDISDLIFIAMERRIVPALNSDSLNVFFLTNTLINIHGMPRSTHIEHTFTGATEIALTRDVSDLSKKIAAAYWQKSGRKESSSRQALDELAQMQYMDQYLAYYNSSLRYSFRPSESESTLYDFSISTQTDSTVSQPENLAEFFRCVQVLDLLRNIKELQPVFSMPDLAKGEVTIAVRPIYFNTDVPSKKSGLRYPLQIAVEKHAPGSGVIDRDTIIAEGIHFADRFDLLHLKAGFSYVLFWLNSLGHTDDSNNPRHVATFDKRHPIWFMLIVVILAALICTGFIGFLAGLFYLPYRLFLLLKRIWLIIFSEKAKRELIERVSAITTVIYDRFKNVLARLLDWLMRWVRLPADFKDTMNSTRESTMEARPCEENKKHEHAQARRASFERAHNRDALAKIVTEDPAMLDAMDKVIKRADDSEPVFIIGERGVGKQLFAELLHDSSDRKSRFPILLDFNCAGLTEQLKEAQLYGYIKGAFTGANCDRAGIFEAAEGNTLFFDEIGEIELKKQSTLLKIIERKSVIRLMGTDSIKVDFKLVAATNTDINDSSKFRQDLRDRLMTPIKIPPLRARKGDVYLLIQHFLKGTGKTFSAAAINTACEYDWPGNIREMNNWVKNGVTNTVGDVVNVSDLEPLVRNKVPVDSDESKILFLLVNEAYAKNGSTRGLIDIVWQLTQEEKYVSVLGRDRAHPNDRNKTQIGKSRFRVKLREAGIILSDPTTFKDL